MKRDGMPGEGTDQERLARALDTIAEVLVGKNLEKMRGSIGDLDARLSGEVASLKKKTTESIDGAKKELSSRLDQLEKLVSASRAKARERIQTAKKELQADLTAKEEHLQKELGGLAQGLSALQIELHEQMESTSRISGMLSNLGTVLTGQPGGPWDGAAAGLAGAPGIPTEENLDTALDQMFSVGSPDESPGDAAPDSDQAGKPKSDSSGKSSRQ